MANSLTNSFVALLLALSPISFLLSIPIFGLALWRGVKGLKNAGAGQHFYVLNVALGAIGLLLDVLILVFWSVAHRTQWFGDSIDSGLFTNVPTLLLALHPLYTLATLNALLAMTASAKRKECRMQ